jgi:hypothetical protein
MGEAHIQQYRKTKACTWPQTVLRSRKELNGMCIEVEMDSAVGRVSVDSSESWRRIHYGQDKGWKGDWSQDPLSLIERVEQADFVGSWREPRRMRVQPEKWVCGGTDCWLSWCRRKRKEGESKMTQVFRMLVPWQCHLLTKWRWEEGQVEWSQCGRWWTSYLPTHWLCEYRELLTSLIFNFLLVRGG